MLHIGWTMAKESVWFGLLPKHIYANPPHVHDVKLEKKSTTMNPVLVRVIIASLLHVMHESGFRDVILIDRYPDVTSEQAFAHSFDLRYVPFLHSSPMFDHA